MTAKSTAERLVKSVLEDGETAKQFLRRREVSSQKSTLPIGTISRGTMNPEDLIRRFLDALNKLDSVEAGKVQKDGANFDDEWEYADYLIGKLGEYCPPYTYFGAHEGDTSDYGCWPNWEAINDDIFHYEETNPEAQALMSGQPVDVPLQTRYVLVGRSKLYDPRTAKLIWQV